MTHLSEEQEKNSCVYTQAYLYVNISSSGINFGAFLRQSFLGRKNSQ